MTTVTADTGSTGTPATPPAATTAAPKANWFKRTFSFIGKILKVAVQDEQKLEPIVVPALKFAFPGLAGLIDAGDAIASKIVAQILVSETVGQAVAAQPTGAQKLSQVVLEVGPEIDAWVTAAFPGASKLSAVGKSGLVQAFYNALQEIDPNAAPAPPAA